MAKGKKRKEEEMFGVLLLRVSASTVVAVMAESMDEAKLLLRVSASTVVAVMAESMDEAKRRAIQAVREDPKGESFPLVEQEGWVAMVMEREARRGEGVWPAAAAAQKKTESA